MACLLFGLAMCSLPRGAPRLPGLRCLLLAVFLTPLPASAKPDSLIEVTDATWEEILTGEWMIEFYAPWCPACQQLQAVWREFADWGDDMGVNIAKVDVTEQPGLSGRFIITSLPTIYHCKDGVFRKYQGARTKDDFLSFIHEHKWQSVEPISSWFGPSSFLMNAMSALFKLSMFIRRCHNYMTEQLGIPNWGSYVIFGLATLFSGLALGLLLVFIADFAFPSRRFSSQDYYHKKASAEQARLLRDDEHEADGEEDDDDEDEEDEEQDEVWRRRRRSSPEGRPEAKGPGFNDEALRKRTVGLLFLFLLFLLFLWTLRKTLLAFPRRPPPPDVALEFCDAFILKVSMFIIQYHAFIFLHVRFFIFLPKFRRLQKQNFFFFVIYSTILKVLDYLECFTK